MFVAGLITGIIIGGNLGVMIMALFKAQRD